MNVRMQKVLERYSVHKRFKPNFAFLQKAPVPLIRWYRNPFKNFGYGYEREFKTFFTQKIKRIDLKERIYSPQRLKFQNETSIQESNIVANFCATVFVLGNSLKYKVDALCYLPFTGSLGGLEVWTFFATSDVPISAAFKDTVTIK